jgi:hypothetical protein
MKKVALAVAVILGFVVVQPVQAADNKALVIIDSYFDSRVAGLNFSCIVVATKTACTDVIKKFPTSLKDNINHGDAMVEVAKKQSTDVKIIGLRSAPSPSDDVFAKNLIEALQWIDLNSSIVGAVSISRNMNTTPSCTPNSKNTSEIAIGNIKGVAAADIIIRQLIVSLKSKNIPVFASTGNGTKIDYPACITDTVSVGTGMLNSSGAIVSVHAFDANTDYFGAYGSNYSSPVLGVIPNTTSSATVAVATQYILKGMPITKVVTVNP